MEVSLDPLLFPYLPCTQVQQWPQWKSITSKLWDTCPFETYVSETHECAPLRCETYVMIYPSVTIRGIAKSGCPETYGL